MICLNQKQGIIKMEEYDIFDNCDGPESVKCARCKKYFECHFGEFSK